ncbi:hypothetical protein [Candidatus Magnetominusculus dajiuhuensis]|uniref:hypothetical protein n=1 Tax=Candidatus Magnetominusculus dajiuhuensis TaxID=3137712 RepID=UPI003B42C3F4
MKALRELLKVSHKQSGGSGGMGHFGQPLTVCYARGAGCNFYNVSKAGISVALSGNSSLVNKIMGKNILIVGRELVYYWREKYPPSVQKNLKGIISNDVAEMFPMIANPAFHFNVFESHANYTLVDIWAWERRVVEEVSKGFYSNYLIPEDLLFISEAPEATIYADGEKIYAFAHGPNGFIGFRTLAVPLSESGVEVFLRGLGAYRQEMRCVNLCGVNLLNGGPIMDIPINFIEDTGFPVSLRGLNSLRLSPFRTRSWHSAVNTELLFRAALYCMAAYLVSSYMSIKKLDASLEDIERETARVTKQINELAELQDKDITAKLLVALAKKVSKFAPPLGVIEVLTRSLADGAYVTQLNINNRNVDVSIVSANPSEVISKLSALKEVETVKLVGEPSREGQTYKFRLSIDMRDTIAGTSNASSPAAFITTSTPSIPQATAVHGAYSRTSIPAAVSNANPNSVGTPRNTVNMASSPSAIVKTNKLF